MPRPKKSEETQQQAAPPAEETPSPEATAATAVAEPEPVEPAAAVDASQSESAPQGPSISEEDLAFLSKKEDILGCLREVESAEGELAEAEDELDKAKENHKAKLVLVEAAHKALKNAVKGNSQGNLFAAPPAAGIFSQPASTPAPAQAAAPSDYDAWQDAYTAHLKATSIDALQVSDSIKDKLRSHRPDPVETLYDLTQVKANHPNLGYCKIKGIGEEKADQLDKAFDAVMEAWLKEHPQPKSGAATPKWDFVKTFPQHVDGNPTSEIYFADTIQELRDILNGHVEGEGEKQAKEIINGFAEEFGQEAADALHAHVKQLVAQDNAADKQEFEAGDYDFVKTFPPAVNPTPNETYDEKYHRAFIKDAVKELTELQAIKRQLESGKDDDGKKLAEKQIKKLQTRQGTVQLQFDEGVAMYHDKFGKAAADAFSRFVTTQAEKKANLKGGLD
jgi:hypothetical protein